jgi:hypothetical protein
MVLSTINPNILEELKMQKIIRETKAIALVVGIFIILVCPGTYSNMNYFSNK